MVGWMDRQKDGWRKPTIVIMIIFNKVICIEAKLTTPKCVKTVADLAPDQLYRSWQTSVNFVD